MLRVVEAGSVSSAARQLGMSRSMLRRRLDALAAAVGCELFASGTSGVALTPAGLAVLEEGRGLLEQAARMVTSARSAESPANGVVRVILPIGMPDLAHVPLASALRATHPGIRVYEREVADPIAHLHEPFELMFHFGPVPTHGRWFSRTMRRLRLVPVASRGYLEAHGRPTSVDELARHTLLGWRRPSSDPTRWPLVTGGAIAVDPFIVSSNGQFMHRCAEAGVGILLGAPEPVFQEIAEIVPVLEDAIADDDAVRVLSPLPVNVDPRARAFVEGVQRFIDTNWVV